MIREGYFQLKFGSRCCIVSLFWTGDWANLIIFVYKVMFFHYFQNCLEKNRSYLEMEIHVAFYMPFLTSDIKILIQSDIFCINFQENS